MAKPALKLAEKTHTEKIQLARDMAKALTANPALVPTPKVTPVQLNAGAQDLEDADQAVTNAESDLITLRTTAGNKETALDGLLTTSANDSAVETGSDTTKLQTLKVPLQSATPGAADTSRLENFNVSHGDHEGAVDGGANRRKGASMYRARCGTSATGPWTVVYEGTRSSFTATGQPVGQLCYFQMSAFVGGVWTEWSDVAQLRIV